MQRFLIKIILFTLLILALISPVVWVNKNILNRPLTGTELKLAPGVDTLLAGDSHAEKSLDPGMLPGSVNVSLSGESLFYTYYKLKCILKQNPGAVRNVVLAFSYHNISKKFSEDTVFDKVISSFLIGRYYQYLDAEGKKRLSGSKYLLFYRMKYDFGIPLMEYTELDTPNLKLLFNSHAEKAKPGGIGGFNPSALSEINQEKIIKKMKLYFFDNHANYTGSSQFMIDYLDSIAALCAENNIKLYLYNAPLHAAYRRLIPAAAYDEYDRVVRAVTKKYPNATAFDISAEALEDRFYEDGDHLDKAGAPFAGRKLYRLLNSLPPDKQGNMK
jgi:hypothetical protein